MSLDTAPAPLHSEPEQAGPVRVAFHEVGRKRESWEQDLPDLSEAAILRAVRARVVFMSNEISASYDEGLNLGAIYAGPAHLIGSFRRLDLAA